MSFAISTFFASRDWIERNRAAARTFASTIYETALWANVHQSDSAEILAKYSKIDLERVRTMTRITYATSLEPQQLQPTLDVAVRYNQLERPIDARTLIVQA